MTATEVKAARLSNKVIGFLYSKGYKLNKQFSIIEKPDGTVQVYYFCKKNPEIGSLINGLDSKFEVLNNTYDEKCAVIHIEG